MPSTFQLFIDGGYLDKQKKRWGTMSIDMRLFRDWCFTTANTSGCTDHFTRYYHCLPFVDETPENRANHPEAIQMQEAKLKRTEVAFDAFTTHAGKFTVVKGRMAPRGDDGGTKICGYHWKWIRAAEEMGWAPIDSDGNEIYLAQKEVDVKMAIDIANTTVDHPDTAHIAILTGDSDFIPVVECMRGIRGIPLSLICGVAGGKKRASERLVEKVQEHGGDVHTFDRDLLKTMPYKPYKKV